MASTTLKSNSTLHEFVPEFFMPCKNIYMVWMFLRKIRCLPLLLWQSQLLKATDNSETVHVIDQGNISRYKVFYRRKAFSNLFSK